MRAAAGDHGQFQSRPDGALAIGFQSMQLLFITAGWAV